MWARVVAWIGLPSFIACIVMFFLMQMFATDLRTTRDNSSAAIRNHQVMMDNEKAIISNQVDILRRLEGLKEADSDAAHYLYALCMNNAETPVQIARCREKE